MQTPLTYLALGDSYTIGEAVPLRETFPYQAVSLMRAAGIPVAAPEIVATTGWTTDELAKGMEGHTFLPAYDLVTLLIGVNNQYRGRSIEEYRAEFTGLLSRAVALAGNQPERVVVLSIPDYGVTPFAKERDPEKIGRELDAFNAAARAICQGHGVSFIDITTGFRSARTNLQLVAADQLHPSGMAYRQWAEALVKLLSSRW